jgi:hypothetical protein
LLSAAFRSLTSDPVAAKANRERNEERQYQELLHRFQFHKQLLGDCRFNYRCKAIAIASGFFSMN